MASRALGSITAVEFTVAPGHDQYERTQRAIAMAAAALTILDGGPTRVLAQFVQLAESQRLLSVGVAQPRRTRSALAQRGMDLPPADPTSVFRALGVNPLLQLWIALFNQACVEDRWDFRVLRHWMLLETMRAALFRRDRRPNKSSLPSIELRYAKTIADLYVIVLSAHEVMHTPSNVRALHGSNHLYDEMLTLYEIRNEVAHQGLFALPPTSRDNEKGRLDVLIFAERSGLGDGVVTGMDRYALFAQSTVEVVIRAELARISTERPLA